MKKAMGSLTMDVIASCAFGTKIDTYYDPKNEFILNARKAFRSNWRFWLFFILMTTFPKLWKWIGFKISDPTVKRFFTSAVSLI